MPQHFCVKVKPKYSFGKVKKKDLLRFCLWSFMNSQSLVNCFVSNRQYCEKFAKYNFFSEDNVLSDEIKIGNIFEYQSNENQAFCFFGDTRYSSL